MPADIDKTTQELATGAVIEHGACTSHLEANRFGVCSSRVQPIAAGLSEKLSLKGSESVLCDAQADQLAYLIINAYIEWRQQ